MCIKFPCFCFPNTDLLVMPRDKRCPEDGSAIHNDCRNKQNHQLLQAMMIPREHTVEGKELTEGEQANAAYCTCTHKKNGVMHMHKTKRVLFSTHGTAARSPLYFYECCCQGNSSPRTIAKNDIEANLQSAVMAGRFTAIVEGLFLPRQHRQYFSSDSSQGSKGHTQAKRIENSTAD